MDSRVLLVHTDPAILRALGAGLRAEGFDAQSASTGSEGWKIFQATRPGLVMTDVDVGELDGFAFASRVRQDPIGKLAAVILVDGSRTAGRRLRAVQSGADSRIPSPDLKGVMTRARLLFGSPKRDAEGSVSTAPRGFACDLADLDVLDLVALVQRNGRSGVGTLTAPGRVPGSLFFDQGRLIDAQSGHASGMEAFHRLACWTSGALNLEWRNFRRRDVLGRTPSDLVTSGLAHVAQWTDLLDQLGTAHTIFRVDLDALIDKLTSTFGQLTEVLNACDGVRSVVQIVDECGIGGLDVLKSLLQLRSDGLISDPGQPARSERARPDLLESTLMGGGAGAIHNLPVAPPLGPPPPSLNPPAPRHDSPATGARLTAPLGQVGLPVSVAEKKNLLAVTMQFPSGVPIPGRVPKPEMPGMPAAAPSAPVAGQPERQLHQGHQGEPAVPKPESPQSRMTMARGLVPRGQPAPPSAQPPVSQAALTIARPQPIVRGASGGEIPPADVARAPHPVNPGFEAHRPWWDRRNEKRAPRAARDVASDSKWDPVWPQAALSPSEPTTALTQVEREPEPAGTAAESPTVYLPASPSSEAKRASRRPAYAEGIRRRPIERGGKRAREKTRGARVHLAWLVAGALVLLGALTAIGVALVRSLAR